MVLTQDRDQELRLLAAEIAETEGCSFVEGLRRARSDTALGASPDDRSYASPATLSTNRNLRLAVFILACLLLVSLAFNAMVFLVLAGLIP